MPCIIPERAFCARLAFVVCCLCQNLVSGVVFGLLTCAAAP